MDKSYQPSEIEQRVYDRWEAAGYFAPRGDGEPYCIMIPPPNVTGTLHMGHGFGDTIQDALTRLWGYQEERGYRPPDLPLAYSVVRMCGLDWGRSTSASRRC